MGSINVALFGPIVMIFLIFIITFSASETQNPDRISVAKAVLNFGQKMVTEILDDREKNSEIISPLSIAGIMHLLQLGAARNTNQELERFLGISEIENKQNIHQIFGSLIEDTSNDIHHREFEVEGNRYEDRRPLVHEISIANGLFIADHLRIRQDYEYTAKSLYKCEVRRMDYVANGTYAKECINKWVDTKTRGKINEILSESPKQDTEMIVVSALYFKAHWLEFFAVDTKTQWLPFYTNGRNGNSKMIEMLIFSENLKYYASEKHNCQLIGLQYQKQLSTMYIILPNNSTRENLKTFQSTLTADDIENMIDESTESHFNMLKLPKFKIQNELSLKKYFRKMGVTTLFTSAADLSAIAAGPNEPEAWFSPTTPEQSIKNLEMIKQSNHTLNPRLYVTEMIHKIHLDVNEKGTEGGAATASFVDRMYHSGLIVEVDTPFLILIRQDFTRLPIFYGPVFEP